jgi:F-type H+-transporting ATPase subunit epsilon
MKLTIITPDKEIFNGKVKSVKVPGTTGQFEILNNHAPIVSSLQKGEVRVITDKGEKLVFPIEQGFVEVLRNEVSVLVSQTAVEREEGESVRK